MHAGCRRTVLDPRASAASAKQMFGKDELTAILRFGAEELFKACAPFLVWVLGFRVRVASLHRPPRRMLASHGITRAVSWRRHGCRACVLPLLADLRHVLHGVPLAAGQLMPKSSRGLMLGTGCLHVQEDEGTKEAKNHQLLTEDIDSILARAEVLAQSHNFPCPAPRPCRACAPCGPAPQPATPSGSQPLCKSPRKTTQAAGARTLAKPICGAMAAGLQPRRTCAAW